MKKKLLFVLDGRLHSVHRKIADNSIWFVIKSNNSKLRFGVSSKHLLKSGYLVKAFDISKMIRVLEIDEDTKSEKWLSYKQFVNLFNVHEVEL